MILPRILKIFARSTPALMSECLSFRRWLTTDRDITRECHWLWAQICCYLRSEAENVKVLGTENQFYCEIKTHFPRNINLCGSFDFKPSIFFCNPRTCSCVGEKTSRNSAHVCFFYYRLSQFRSSVVKVFSSRHSQSLPLDELTDHVNSDPATQFSRAEVNAALDMMQSANQVMVSDNVVFLI